MINARLEGSLLFEFNEQQAKFIDEMIAQLAWCGEEAVRLARTDHSGFMDHSGNLRSSIGYCIYVDGHKAVGGQFDKVENADSGPAQGETLADQVGAQTHGIALVVVAGMEYASYVENIKGHHVLAPARLETEANVREALKGLVKGL